MNDANGGSTGNRNTARPGDYLVFVCLCQCVQMFMSYDGGATPACIDSIASGSDLVWTEAELGLLGSLDKFGMTVSSVLWGRILQVAPPKLLLTGGLGLNALSTLMFGTVPVKEVMYVAKVLMGVTQALQVVWSTCWVLTWAPLPSRTFWLGMGAISAGIGNGIGTAVAGFTTGAGLPYAFAYQVQSSILGILWLILVFVVSKDQLELTDESLEAEEQEEEEQEEDCEAEEERLRIWQSQCAPDQDMHRKSMSHGAVGVGPNRKLHAPVRHDYTATQLPSLPENYDDGKVQSITDDFSNPARIRKSTKSSAISFGTRINSTRSSALSFGRAESRAIGFGRAISMNARRRRGSMDGIAETPLKKRTESVWEVQVPIISVETGMMSMLWELLKCRLYIRTAFCLASVVFVTSGVQFIWVRLFTVAWGLPKGFVVTGFLLSTGVGGAAGVACGPGAIDRCGGFESYEGRRRSLRLIAWMVLVALLGASLGFGALVLQSMRLDPDVFVRVAAVVPAADASNATETNSTGGSAATAGGVDVLMCVIWVGCFIMFAAYNSTMAGLTGINVSAVEPAMWSLGSGVTVSLQNLLGGSMGPLLPGFVMDRICSVFSLEMVPPTSGRVLCYGAMTVLGGVLVSLTCTLAALAAVGGTSRAELDDEGYRVLSKPASEEED